jgi:hypothetical protein
MAARRCDRAAVGTDGPDFRFQKRGFIDAQHDVILNHGRRELFGNFRQFRRFPFHPINDWRFSMKYALVIATAAVLATPAFAEEVGVRVGPVGAGVTVGEGHDRDRDRERTTVIKEREREPAGRTTVIRKDHDDDVRTKTIIKDRD